MKNENFILIAALFIVLFIASLGFILGFAIGTYNQETILLSEIMIRDYNLTGKMCILDPNTKQLAVLKRPITEDDFNLTCVQKWDNEI